jgi:Zn-dependent protease
LLLSRLDPQTLIINLLVLLIAMTVHEFAHNYVAYLMGDPVPKREGRLTLNPMVHINWFGWLMFAIIGFGILGSAPIAAYRMRNPRWGFLAAVAAGPISNLLLAIIFAIILRFAGGPRIDNLFGLFLVQAVLLNVILCLFNLIPLFPLDGWHIVLSLLPPDLAYSWQRHMQTSQYIFFGLLLLSFLPVGGFNILGIVIFQPAIQIVSWLIGLGFR